MINGSINKDDIIQVVIGASALTIPVAFSEEAWKLSETLPLLNVMILLGLSLILISYIPFKGYLLGTLTIVYGITLVVVFLVLFAINRKPIFDNPIIALKRIILISFPASLGGVIVDGFDKE